MRKPCKRRAVGLKDSSIDTPGSGRKAALAPGPSSDTFKSGTRTKAATGTRKHHGADRWVGLGLVQRSPQIAVHLAA